jgi:hypothetical protein
LLTLSLSPAATAETVDEILARHLAARGGAEKLASVRALRIKGRFFEGSTEAPFLYEWKRPNQYRFEITVGGMTESQGFDGKAGWSLDPSEQPEPAPLAPLELALMNDAVDFEGPLVNPAAKGAKVELMGKTEVEGTPAWELKVVRADGGVERSFLDAETFLEILQVERYEAPGGAFDLEVTWSDYKEVAGALFPGSWSRKPKGGSGATTVLFESIEPNPDLPDERFKMPAKPAGKG